MITNFITSHKTRVPSCCSLSCCGNKFGRISGRNKIKKMRRYAKRAERNPIRNEIRNEQE